MYDVNQFTIIGKFLKLESHRNNVFFYLKTDNRKNILLYATKLFFLSDKY